MVKRLLFPTIHRNHIMFPDVNPAEKLLVFVNTADHASTVRSQTPVLRRRGVRLVILSWEVLFQLDQVPVAGWILSDFDRLGPSELEAAGAIAARLRAAGCQVLNDPLLFRPRHMLLRALRAAGLNPVGTWQPGAGEWPDRWPVFLRTIAAHRGAASDLLPDRAAAEAAVRAALANGQTLADLLLVEFAAAETPDGLWQKHAAFCVGDRIVRANTVNDAGWMAKQGTQGLAPDAVYAQERSAMLDFPHARQVKAVFDAAGIAFGRMDYGLLHGQIVTYEINTNPFLPKPKPHPNPDRTETMRLMRQGLADALAPLGQSPGDRLADLREAFQPSRHTEGPRPRRH
jgi:hypothetical protein